MPARVRRPTGIPQEFQESTKIAIKAHARGHATCGATANARDRARSGRDVLRLRSGNTGATRNGRRERGNSHSGIRRIAGALRNAENRGFSKPIEHPGATPRLGDSSDASRYARSPYVRWHPRTRPRTLARQMDGGPRLRTRGRSFLVVDGPAPRSPESRAPWRPHFSRTSSRQNCFPSPSASPSVPLSRSGVGATEHRHSPLGCQLPRVRSPRPVESRRGGLDARCRKHREWTSGN